MVDLSVDLCGMHMENPVVPASGTFGFGKEFKDFYDINMLGSFSFKGTTKEPRFGNPNASNSGHDQCRWPAKPRRSSCDRA